MSRLVFMSCCVTEPHPAHTAGPGFGTFRCPGVEAAINAGPVPIFLPPEPPRDRRIEAVDAGGTVVDRWWWDRDSWRCQGLYSRCPDGSWAFMEIAAEADSNGWSLRHVPAEGGEKP